MKRAWFERALSNCTPAAMVLAGLLGMLLLVVATQSVMTHPLMYDELLHLLAARGVVATGEPAIAEGFYRRAEIFTRLMAWSFEMRGESPMVARLPALAGGLGLVLLTGAWVTRHAGLLAGTVASVLLAISPSSIELAAFARFYSIHALVILVLYVAAYEASVPGRSGFARIAWGSLAVASIPIAWHLQKSTLIALGGAAAGVLALVFIDHRNEVATTLKRRPLAFVLAAVALVAAGAFGAWRLGIHELAGVAPLWAQERSGDSGFYLRMFGREWPFFWTVLPLGAVAAISGFRRFAWFCVVVPLAAIAVHSVSAAKAMRYVYYAMPLLCAVIGCGVAVGLRLLAGWIEASWPALGPRSSAIAALIVLVTAVNTLEARFVAGFLVSDATWSRLGMYASESDWDSAVPILRPHVSHGRTIVVSSAVKGLYYLGDYDYELNASTVVESETGAEFGRDRRTGKLAIGTRDSLAKVLAQPGGTLVVVDEDKLGRSSGVSRDVVALIESRCDTLAVPAESSLSAWVCSARGSADSQTK